MILRIRKSEGIPDIIRKLTIGEDSGKFIIKDAVILR